uniref:Uncharacterized protein n=1 Tax=Anopheles farauti TaxID=69004 RepID=A0A182QBP2_9DIPT
MPSRDLHRYPCVAHYDPVDKESNFVANQGGTKKAKRDLEVDNLKETIKRLQEESETEKKRHAEQTALLQELVDSTLKEKEIEESQYIKLLEEYAELQKTLKDFMTSWKKQDEKTILKATDPNRLQREHETEPFQKQIQREHRAAARRNTLPKKKSPSVNRGNNQQEDPVASQGELAGDYWQEVRDKRIGIQNQYHQQQVPQK